MIDCTKQYTTCTTYCIRRFYRSICDEKNNPIYFIKKRITALKFVLIFVEYFCRKRNRLIYWCCHMVKLQLLIEQWIRHYVNLHVEFQEIMNYPNQDIVALSDVIVNIAKLY